MIIKFGVQFRSLNQENIRKCYEEKAEITEEFYHNKEKECKKLIQELKNRIKSHQAPKETNKITSLEIQKEKLIAQLDDGREVIFPISLLTKLEILSPEIKPEQLKKYEL